MYYNTVDLSGKDLAQARERASNQDTDILNCAIAIHHERKQITPWRLWKVYKHNYSNIQITSVRRSVNTLLKDNKLKYTGNKLTHSDTLDNFTTTERTLTIVQ